MKWIQNHLWVFETEEKLLLKPFSFYVKCFAINEDLFAGKMHALLSENGEIT